MIFLKKHSTEVLLSLLSNSLPFALLHFSESLTVALEISKKFERMSHKALISMLIYRSICVLSPSFLSCIAASLDGHHSSFKLNNSGVSQKSLQFLNFSTIHY